MKNENPAMLVPPERFAENVKTIRARVAPPVSFQLLSETLVRRVQRRMLPHTIRRHLAVTHSSIRAFLKRQIALNSRTADREYVLKFLERTGKLRGVKA